MSSTGRVMTPSAWASSKPKRSVARKSSFVPMSMSIRTPTLVGAKASPCGPGFDGLLDGTALPAVIVRQLVPLLGDRVEVFGGSDSARERGRPGHQHDDRVERTDEQQRRSGERAPAQRPDEADQPDREEVPAT